MATHENRSWPELAGMAYEAHEDGVTWSTFWPRVAGDVRRLQERCPDSHVPLYARLLSIVAAGDESGVEPPGESILIECQDVRVGWPTSIEG